MADQPAENDSYGGGQSRETTDRDASSTGGTVDWLTVSALRLTLALAGLVLLLYALGRAVGVDLLDAVADALSTQLGRWFVVALVALALIVVALRGFGTRTE